MRDHSPQAPLWGLKAQLELSEAEGSQPDARRLSSGSQPDASRRLSAGSAPGPSRRLNKKALVSIFFSSKKKIRLVCWRVTCWRHQGVCGVGEAYTMLAVFLRGPRVDASLNALTFWNLSIVPKVTRFRGVLGSRARRAVLVPRSGRRRPARDGLRPLDLLRPGRAPASIFAVFK